MVTTLIPRIIYYAYDLLNKGKLQKYYRQAKAANTVLHPVADAELSTFLTKNGFVAALEKNPLMDKEAVKNAINKFVTPNNVHSWAYTGGSYGEPLRVPYSKERALKRTATFKYFNEQGGYQLGDRFVLIRAKSRPALLKYLRNEHIFIPHDISKPKLAAFANELRFRRIKVLMGYPSVVYELALYLLEHPEEIRGIEINSIITVSEPLEDFKRSVIRSVFMGQFVDRYSNEEVGLIAQQMEYGGEYVVNKYGVVTEVVDPETLLPVAEGMMGKVVVTDLYNDLIPMVRYDTGDLAVAHRYVNGRLDSISGISGRLTEQITTTLGDPVSPLTLGPFIYKPLSEAGRVCQYQFAQTGERDYELRLKISKEEVSNPVLQTIAKNLASILGQGAHVKVVLQDDIPALPSGKRPVFKNEYKATKRYETVI